MIGLIIIIYTFFPESSIYRDSIQQEGYFEFDKEIIDIGSIRKDSIVEARFTGYNHGSKTIEILKLSKSCSCSSFTVNKYEVQPMDSITIVMTVNTKDQTGLFKVSGILITNTERRFYRVTIQGNKD